MNTAIVNSSFGWPHLKIYNIAVENEDDDEVLDCFNPEIYHNRGNQYHIDNNNLTDIDENIEIVETGNHTNI